jgi:hypothetical protein
VPLSLAAGLRGRGAALLRQPVAVQPVPKSVLGNARHLGKSGGGKPTAPILGDSHRSRLSRAAHTTACVPFQNRELVVHHVGHPCCPRAPLQARSHGRYRDVYTCFPREPSSWRLGRKSALIQITIRADHQEVLAQIADNRKGPFL